jgi:hypothetical protein
VTMGTTPRCSGAWLRPMQKLICEKLRDYHPSRAGMLDSMLANCRLYESVREPNQSVDNTTTYNQN